MTIKVTPVSPQAFVQWWHIVEGLLLAALPIMMGRYLPIDVIDILYRDRTYQGWFVHEDDNLLAVMVSQIVSYPRRKGCNLWMVSGKEMSRWFDLAEQTLSKYAKDNNCQFFECSGRKGWERRLGLEPRSCYFVKEFDSNEE